jgi:hypothetical protein
MNNNQLFNKWSTTNSYYLVMVSSLKQMRYLMKLSFLCLFVYSDVQHILCCVFLRLVYPVLPVSLDCPFLIAPSVFSKPKD